MLATIFIVIAAVLFCRYALPFLILAVAGMIVRDDAMVQNNKQNIISAKQSEVPFTASHIIERLAVYLDTLLIGIVLFFPAISFPFIIALLGTLLVQLFLCAYTLKNGTSYTWVLATSILNKRRGRSYNNSINGNVQSNRHMQNNNSNYYGGQSNGYGNVGYAQDYGNTGYGYGVNQNGNIGRINRNIQFNSSITPNGKRAADGNIQGLPVWSVNRSKKCFITEDGMIIHKGSGFMKSSQGVNIADKDKTKIFVFRGEEVNSILRSLSKIKASVNINDKGLMHNELYVMTDGTVLDTPFTNARFPAVSRILGGKIVIKNPESNYYVAEFEEKGQMIISVLKKNDTGYEFVTIMDEVRKVIMLDNDFQINEDKTDEINVVEKGLCKPTNTEDTVDDATMPSEDKDEAVSKDLLVKSLDVAKDTIASLNSTVVKINDAILKNKPLGGLGDDGVYNDGTVDVMCYFGELLTYVSTNNEPEVKALIAAKLIPNKSVNDVMTRIGDGWTDTSLNGLCDAITIAIKDILASKTSSVLNYWITDDCNVYYASIVCDASADSESFNQSAFARKMAHHFLLCGIKLNADIGYKEYTYLADVSKFKTNEGELQSYFNINPLSLDYNLFIDNLTKIDNVSEVFKTVIVQTKLSFRASIDDIHSYGSGEDVAYGARLSMRRQVVDDWIRNKKVKAITLKTCVSTPLKIKDALYEAIQGNKIKQKIKGNTFNKNFSPVFAFVYDIGKDTVPVNFLFMDKEEQEDFEYTYEKLLNTPLIAYACYINTGVDIKYALSTSDSSKMTILMFNREKE